ncbi:filamentous hemagglutinin N-terminal domain-containing protein [Moorena producens JHB]|uniref:Filamentous hemagglutinin N-terminal domain-containing protein n=1 Tax=Moorena producens (strain JHB) TaxID=1454205 RepID=A0A1D9G7Q4_MOOP1|nr:filamentous hemagglutinin N-terminal domain-containing protein [Moorena producens]AOY83658.2 filamentous hemagglutinin N-terminal domain-containing protein [Moorena producens JHB]
MKILRTLVIFGGLSLSGYYGITNSVNPALAQIVPDDTLGDNPTVVKPNVEVKGLPADLIEGGATRGDNLFHSFSDFNVGDLQRVYFANPAGINNILGRVTGSNISKIFGTLGVDGAANLFLLNPNGIVFGANSQLDVAGSFVGSTAKSIVFGNGTEFSATNPEEPPLLTINITPGLQYGKTGLQYGQNPPQPIVNAGNLAVGQGQNVTLVGGSVISTGDILAPGGEINILAVPSETLVQLGQAGQILTLSTPTVPLTPSAPASVTEFLSSLDHDTGVTVSSDGQVTLTDSGTQVPLEPGTVIISGALSAANPFPGQTGGKVTVLGDQVGLFDSASIDVSGNSSGGEALIGGDFQGQGQLPLATATYIGPDTTINADGVSTGNGGLIVIWSNQSTRAYGTLTARGGAQSGNGGLIETSSANFLDVTGVRVDASAANGNAGTWLLDPRNVTLGFADTSNGTFDSNSNIFTPTGDEAVVNIPDIEAQLNAGTNVTITTGNTGTQEGNITADDFGITKTTDGEVTLSLQAANDISLKNVDINANSGFLNLVLEADSDNSGSGDVELMDGSIDTGGGAVTITAAGAIALQDLTINSDTESERNAGDITITAGSLLLENNSDIDSNTKGNSTGNAGNITITVAESVVFRGDSGLGSSTQGKSTGNGGEITITATSVLFEDKGSGIGSNTEGHSSGNGGKITITADSVVFNNQSGIGTNTTGKSTGNGGEITITAGYLLFDDKGTSTGKERTGLGSDTEGHSTGDAGTITITADSVVFRGNSGLGTNTQGKSTGNAGEVTITAGYLLLEDNRTGFGSDTQGNSSGDAGTITITADSVVFRGNSGLGTNTQGKSTGDAGEIIITAGSLLFENQSGIGSNTQGDSSGNAGKITITADSIVLTGDSGIGTNTQGNSTGHAGIIEINADSISLENLSKIESTTDTMGNAGKITINGQSIVLENQARISNNTKENSTGDAGTITINADSISLENNSNISSQTASGDGGNITLTLQDLLLLRNGSQISTSAGTEDQPGNGGDITITADLIVAFLEENSDITANAFDGMGGNITLTAQGIFGFNFPDQLTDFSDITASSERGVDGNITINILGVNPSQGLVELPTTVVDPSTLIAASCTNNVKVGSNTSKGDEFIITGRGGLPPSPLDPIISQTVIADWVTLDNSETENYQSQITPAAREESARKRPRRRIVEAQGWLIGPDGTVILTAFPTTPEAWANSWRKSPSCQDLRRITNGS